MTTNKIHHLNCGTMRPRGAGRFDKDLALFPCHCLLVETDKSLVLVDAGVGVEDMDDPRRLGPMRFALNLKRDRADTAIMQTKALGYDPKDVRHIICTHLDLDHAGGLPDFPWAFVHVPETEYAAATRPESYRAKERYRGAHFAHGPIWVRHEKLDADKWFGMDALPLGDGLEDFLLVPLPGHTPGHCAVAVKKDSGWLLHCGDAYYSSEELGADSSKNPLMKAFTHFAHTDFPLAAAQKNRIRQLMGEKDISLCSSHVPQEYERFSGRPLQA
ncbi:MAG: MBL fold metallo-hydrolase [Desulfatibacillaceae bacterium]|nr:MBL fold metallo-hydrolase [Desulfatibacillaceae bacterium]